MVQPTRIPIRVHRTNGTRAQLTDPNPTQLPGGKAAHQAHEPEPLPERTTNDRKTPDIDIAAETVDNTLAPDVSDDGESGYWKDRALRLQAEMENYRRRQGRLAQDRIDTERQQLLTAFLAVVDDLERALAVSGDGDPGLRHGVEVTHRAALQWLEKQGVERLEALGQHFDPTWHEAIATVDGQATGRPVDTVVQVQEAGYGLNGALLRPAKVVVAV